MTIDTATASVERLAGQYEGTAPCGDACKSRTVGVCQCADTAATLRALAAERDEARAMLAMRNVEDMNDLVLMGLARDEAEAARDAALQRAEAMRKVVRALWEARCDADALDRVLERHGFVEWRTATKADASQPFAKDRGIYAGELMIVLTAAGRAALAAQEASDAR